jgi:SAM-dependent methyltransferase
MAGALEPGLTPLANIHYQTPHLAAYFAAHRRCWDEFYPSERWMFEQIGEQPGGFGRLLDVGCAVGGLGRALEEKFPLTSYFGLDINAAAIEAARDLPALAAPARFECGDIVATEGIADGEFDTVAALSVADWNVETDAIIAACWRKVAPRGRLVISLRLTEQAGTRDPDVSFQPIVPSEDFVPPDGAAVETAPYVVLNGSEALDMFLQLDPAPADILAYGYWGTPSKTATTPYNRLAFAVLSIARGDSDGSRQDTRLESHLPAAVFAGASTKGETKQ